MSGQIAYDFGAIEVARGDIQRNSTALNTTLEDLKRSLREIESAWQGASSEAYRAAQTKWDTAAADLNQVLAAIGTAVGTGNEGMQHTESAAARAWG